MGRSTYPWGGWCSKTPGFSERRTFLLDICLNGAVIARSKGDERTGMEEGAMEGAGILYSGVTRPSCRRLVHLSAAIKVCGSHLNETNKAGMVHCWEKINLLRVWEHEVQIEYRVYVDFLLPQPPSRMSFCLLRREQHPSSGERSGCPGRLVRLVQWLHPPTS